MPEYAFFFRSFELLFNAHTPLLLNVRPLLLAVLCARTRDVLSRNDA